MHDGQNAPLNGENIFGASEPARDLALGALLGDVAGAPPFGDVDWSALAQRIASARARQTSAWWSYATRWERRAIPVAFAAGLAGVLALWGLGMPTSTRSASRPMVSDPLAAMVEGTPAADAARSYSRSLMNVDDVAMVEDY